MTQLPLKCFKRGKQKDYGNFLLAVIGCLASDLKMISLCDNQLELGEGSNGQCCFRSHPRSTMLSHLPLSLSVSLSRKHTCPHAHARTEGTGVANEGQLWFTVVLIGSLE